MFKERCWIRFIHRDSQTTILFIMCDRCGCDHIYETNYSFFLELCKYRLGIRENTFQIMQCKHNNIILKRMFVVI